MNTKRLLSASTALATVVALAACDAEFDRDGDDAELDRADSESSPDDFSAIDDDESLEPSEADRPDEWGAPSDEQASSCDLGLPDLVRSPRLNSGTAMGVLSGIPSGSYTIQVTPALTNPGSLLYWLLDINGVWADSSVATPTPFTAGTGDSIELFMQAPSSGLVGWIYDFDVDLYTSPGHQLVCSDTTALELQEDCGSVAWWWTGSWPNPWNDGANCYVAPLPANVTSFVWGNNWYVEPTNGTQCAIGWYDGANCYIGSAPWGQAAFIWNGNMYYAL